MAKHENIIPVKKVMRSLTIMEQAHKKNILASRAFKTLTNTDAWSFVENELQRSTCHEQLIDPLGMAQVFNKYFQMQWNQCCYNMVDGERLIDGYTGMPDYQLHYWLDNTLNAYCQTQHNGLITANNYYAIPRIIVENAGISNANSCVIPAPLGSLWKDHISEKRGEAIAPKKKKLIRFVSSWDISKLERFVNNIQIQKTDYSRPLNLITREFPLFNLIFNDFEKSSELKDVFANLKEFKKRLKTHTYLLEVIAIAFYYSLVTMDEDNFLFKIRALKFTTVDAETGKEMEDKAAIKKVIDITKCAMMAFTNIDPASSLDEMNEFYQTIFTYPAKPLFEYD
ncbi:hypothetical protein [Buttiauxella sp. S19-1]|uniref:hypothetical protein n=1 Tax=Buttiauxella sp. S19-1 TaxID=941430 RepID=UPI001EDB231A|nr:hypothetical protein [Buttiauxella sp. S19-1]